MNKKLYIGLFVMLILVVGSYLFYKKENSSVSEQKVITSESVEQKVDENAGSLADIFAAAGGPSQTCTFENTTENGKASGVVYTSKSKMRGDFSTQMDGKVAESHMIVVDNTSYLWQDGEKTGMKSVFGEESLKVIDPPKTVPDTESDTIPTGVMPDTGSFECKDWSVDDSFFDLPDNVEFLSLNDMTGASGTQLEGSNSCAVCESLPGEQKTQCLKSLDCN